MPLCQLRAETRALHHTCSGAPPAAPSRVVPQDRAASCARASRTLEWQTIDVRLHHLFCSAHKSHWRAFVLFLLARRRNIYIVSCCLAVFVLPVQCAIPPLGPSTIHTARPASSVARSLPPNSQCARAISGDSESRACRLGVGLIARSHDEKRIAEAPQRVNKIERGEGAGAGESKRM